MKNLVLFIFTWFTLLNPVTAQQIKSPEAFLGYKLGTQFTPHYKVVQYFKHLSENSQGVELENYGKTNEGRDLQLAYISSEENIKNLEEIRIGNLGRTGILDKINTREIAIVWLSYNVHGNEASSTEAAMQTAYDLLVNNNNWLLNTLVILDPCLNPDGRERYVNWYNQVKSTPYNNNPDAIEHHEPWPGGRPNHYLFDLNRDWAWASQIETQFRLKVYNKWMPHIHVDFHEQFINSPYYFAPAAQPFHEIITPWQRNFQTQIGKNNAKYFDKNGWLYFTKEHFDLLYPSYGDTYPTYMGAIGMTYEQAGHGRAGLGITIENGTELTLIDRVAHHTTAGLSTVEMASQQSANMIAEFEKFFDNSKLKYKSYILRGTPEKIEQVQLFLDQHEIGSFFAEEKTVKAFDYLSKSIKTIKTSLNDLVINTEQPKGKMVQVLFEPETKLIDSATYDITAWSIPYAFGLQGFATETSINSEGTSEKSKPAQINNLVTKNAYAYIAKWSEVSDAKLLGCLLQNGFKIRYAEKDFSLQNKNYTKGSFVVLKADNLHIENFDLTIAQLANSAKKMIDAVQTGFSTNGPDLGSGSFVLIHNKNIAALAGDGISSLNFGEIWHFFEKQLYYPLHVLNVQNINRVDLSKYQVLILPEGYNANKNQFEILTSYLNNGGKIVAIGSAMRNFSDKEEFALKQKKNDDGAKAKSNLVPYELRERTGLKNNLYGSIFQANIDNTHPLGYGYSKTYLSLKLNSASYELLENGFNIGYYDQNAEVISGFAGVNSAQMVPNSLLFGVEFKGRGKIIYLSDNPLFRSFWQNGKLFFANAVFLN
jgi:hypothetical protein